MNERHHVQQYAEAIKVLHAAVVGTPAETAALSLIAELKTLSERLALLEQAITETTPDPDDVVIILGDNMEISSQSRYPNGTKQFTCKRRG